MTRKEFEKSELWIGLNDFKAEIDAYYDSILRKKGAVVEPCRLIKIKLEQLLVALNTHGWKFVPPNHLEGLLRNGNNHIQMIQDTWSQWDDKKDINNTGPLQQIAQYLEELDGRVALIERFKNIAVQQSVLGYQNY